MSRSVPTALLWIARMQRDTDAIRATQLQKQNNQTGFILL